MKTQRLNLEAKFQKQTSYLKGIWNATWQCYGEFRSSSPELYLLACKAIKIMTMASLPKTGKMLWTATLEILSWLLAHLVPVLVFLFLLVRNFLDSSSEINLKLTSWGGVTSVVVGQLWTSICPFPFLSFLNLCQKKEPTWWRHKSSLRQHGKNQWDLEELRFCMYKSQFVFSFSLFPSNTFNPDILSC